jgi:hypothetical protein
VRQRRGIDVAAGCGMLKADKRGENRLQGMGMAARNQLPNLAAGPTSRQEPPVNQTPP